MADKNQHNLDAARKAGRKEFANETRMLVESMQVQGILDEDIVIAVLAKANDEAAS